MAKVTGLGGLFYKVADTKATGVWYQENLGIGGEWGIMFPWSDETHADPMSLLSAFKPETDYFGPSARDFMINLRVDDCDAMVEALKAKGIDILGTQDDEYGKFAWFLDCDGVKVELWEQKGPAPE